MRRVRAADAEPDDAPGDLVVAHLPATPAFIRLARLLVGFFVETHLEVTPLRDQGVRLAVTEAFTAALDAHTRAAVDAPLVLRLSLQDGTACIAIHDAAGPVDEDDDESESAVRAGMVLARALVDDAWVEPTPAGRVFHLVVSKGPA